MVLPSGNQENAKAGMNIIWCLPAAAITFRAGGGVLLSVVPVHPDSSAQEKTY